MRAPGRAAALLAVLLLATLPVRGEEAPALPVAEPTVVHALAVAETARGFEGHLSTVSISVAPGGSGHVFVDTSPLAQVDMQGSARLAVRVASSVSGLPLEEHDYFYVVRSDASVVGGPSAGAILTVGTIAALKGWAVNHSVMMTGTITPDGDVGPIGGLLEKIQAAARGGATLFLFPEGQDHALPLGTVGASPVAVGGHCERLRIACLPVGQVEEAVAHVTGHAFDPRPPAGNVTSADFRATMQPLARSLTGQARDLVQDANDHLRAAAGLPRTLREDLERRLGEASLAVVQADTAYGEERYYTASSRSFQASVAARYVDDAVGLYGAGDREAYLRGAVEDAEDRAEAAMQASRQPVLGVAHLEGLGAAQARASEAERAAQAARAAFGQGDPLAALQWAAQARERSESVGWWLDIARSAPQAEQPLDAEVLNRTARDLVDTARESLTYAGVILAEAGDPGRLAAPGGARDLLERAAADAERDFIPAAIFEAIEAEVRASVALELAASGGEVPASKLERASARAAAAIVQARADGLEPLLAQSYFEFAGDLATPEDALAFYHTARSVASLGHSFFGPQEAAPRASRFVGFPPAPAPRGSFVDLAGGAAALLAVLVVGLAAGLALGLAAARRAPAPPRLPPAPAPPPAPLDPLVGGANDPRRDAAPSAPPPAEPAPPAPSEPAERSGQGPAPEAEGVR